MTYVSKLCLLIYWTCVGNTLGAQFSSVASLYDYLSVRSYRYVRPEADLNAATKVDLSFNLVNLQSLDENAGLFSVAGYLEFHWNDKQLVWDPSLYDGQDKVRLPKTSLWTPHIVVGNPYSKGQVIDLKDSTVTLYSSGDAYWSPAASYQSACDSDVTYYPFDTQKCVINFVPWSYWPDEIAVGIKSSTAIVTYYSQNPQWDYISSNVYNKSTEVFVEMTFKRRPAFFMINIMFPIILLGVLNLFVFILPADSGERVGFSITLLLAVSVFMTILADSMPSTSSPRLAIVCAKLIADLGISALLVVCTIFGLVFHHRDDCLPVTPFWIKVMKVKQVSRLCSRRRSSETDDNRDMRDDDGNLKKATGNTEDVKWKDVRSFFDYFCLIFFTIVIVVANFAFFIDIVVGTN